ncbi:MAG: hypothetical protein ACRC5T_11270 [Cetobacterium sp.]
MTGDIKLTAFNRQGSKSHVSERGEDDFPKPRIKLIHPSGEIRYFFLEETTVEENPKFSVIINGVKHYIGKSGWAIDFIFSSASNSLKNLVSNSYNVTTDDIQASSIISMTGSDGYKGLVLAPNGKIYGIPCNSTTALEVNIENGTVFTFGDSQGAVKFDGGVLAPNGKIYGIPYILSSVLEIDPITKTLSFFPAETNECIGGVLAPNGKIYGIPHYYGYVLEINPFDKTSTKFNGISKMYGGALGLDGKIYCVPYDATSVLIIDPTTKTTSSLGSFSSGGSKYRGAVTAPNGKIYGMGYFSGNFLEIDPENNSFSTFGVAPAQGCDGGVLAPNGKIYGVVRQGSATLEIDPTTKTVMTINDVSGVTSQRCGVLTPDGNIYQLPTTSGNMRKINVGEFKNNGILSPYFNKY